MSAEMDKRSCQQLAKKTMVKKPFRRLPFIRIRQCIGRAQWHEDLTSSSVDVESELGESGWVCVMEAHLGVGGVCPCSSSIRKEVTYDQAATGDDQGHKPEQSQRVKHVRINDCTGKMKLAIVARTPNGSIDGGEDTSCELQTPPRKLRSFSAPSHQAS